MHRGSEDLEYIAVVSLRFRPLKLHSVFSTFIYHYDDGEKLADTQTRAFKPEVLTFLPFLYMSFH